MELSSDQKGAIAEKAIELAALKLGIDVFRPVGDGGRCDMIFGIADRLVRVQCKWARRRGDALVVPFLTSRRGAAGYVRRPYTREQIDAVAAYYLDGERCYFLPIAVFGERTHVQLRLAPARNNQRIGVWWADDFAFDRLHWHGAGAIAQLGERLHGMQEVAGSSPAGSTEEPASRAGSPLLESLRNLPSTGHESTARLCPCVRG
jgi:hypothetical protein